MPAVVFYFHLHQPYRIKSLSLFDVRNSEPIQSDSWQSPQNSTILRKVAAKCYLPATRMWLELLEKHSKLHLSFSLTGTLIEQLLAYEPEVIHLFRLLSQTGRVEFVDETYYHSLASLFSESEFFYQVSLHRQLFQELFDQTPTAFRNTELIYNNHLAGLVSQMGYQAVLAEGVDRYLGWRSPNFLYHPPSLPNLTLLLKNYSLSDDIAFRFSNRSWSGYPLTASKYADWLTSLNGNADIINLFMDYETIGEHQWADTGIFDFFRALPAEILHRPDNTFMTITQAAKTFPVRDAVDMPDITSWADLERDVTAWLGNPLQRQAAAALYGLYAEVSQSADPRLLQTWRYLTTSDHFYYMCTKWFADGDVHKYFSPNRSPFEAYVNFFNLLHQLRQKLYAKTQVKPSAYPLITGIPAHDYRHTQAL